MSLTRQVGNNIINSRDKEKTKQWQNETQTTRYGRREDGGSEEWSVDTAYKDLSNLSPETLEMKKYVYGNQAFKPSANVDNARKLMQTSQNKVKNHNPYENAFQNMLDGMRDQYMNREAFNYNFNEDALYDMYRQQYEQLAKEASMNAAANAAALSGGYGNSYGTSAAAQAGQQYMTQLNNMLPELQQMALDRYNAEGDLLLNKYNLLNNEDEKGYGRWVDEDNRLRADQDYYTNDYYNLYNQEENTHNNDFNNAFNLYNLGLQYESKDVNDHRGGTMNWNQLSGEDITTDKMKGGQTAWKKGKQVEDSTATSYSSGSGGSGGNKKGSTGGNTVPDMNKKDYKTIKDEAASRITSYSDVGAISYLLNLYGNYKINESDMNKIREELGLRKFTDGDMDKYGNKSLKLKGEFKGNTNGTKVSNKNGKKK